VRGLRVDGWRRARRGVVMTVVPAEDMARLLTVLRDEYGGSVDALLVAARKGAAARGRSRRLPDPVPLRTAAEVLDGVRMKLVTREEARRLLGLRSTRPRGRAARASTAPTSEPGGPVANWRASA
jgi:hypothetical protein